VNRTLKLNVHVSFLHWQLKNIYAINDFFLPQNFDSIPHVPEGKEQYYGGSVSLADYCPYIQEFTWRVRNIVVRGSHCLYEENNPHKLHGKHASREKCIAEFAVK